MPFDFPQILNPGLPALWCLFDGTQVVVLPDGLPDNRAERWAHTSPHFLGVYDGCNLFTANLVGPPPDGSLLLPLRQALLGLPPEQAAALTRAIQLMRFERSHRYCGSCASPLVSHSHDQGKSCPSCSAVYYPRLSPAMMVLIHDDDKRLLLARSPRFAPGVYSALAGYVEPGESLEECVHREVHEEVGVSLRNLNYVTSQSWPFPHSLMLAFSAEYAGGEIVLQEEEIEDAAWFELDRLPPLPPPLSIANRLIRHMAQKLHIDHQST